MSNPFDLKQRKTARAQAPEYSESEQQALLEGFFEVPRELWPLIEPGVFVRYYTTKNEGAESKVVFRSGGVVEKNPLDYALAGGEAVRGMTLAANSKSWIVNYSKAVRIFARHSVEIFMLKRTLRDAIAKLNQNIRKVEARVEAVEARTGLSPVARQGRGLAAARPPTGSASPSGISPRARSSERARSR